MRTFIYFITTAFIATGVYIAALNSSNAVPGIMLSMALWLWFLWGWKRRSDKASKRNRY